MAAAADTDRPVKPRAWTSRDMSGAYEELEHPADLLLEIRGDSLGALLENALYALYSEMVELASLGGERTQVLRVRASTPEQALRALLAEALYCYDVERFAAAAAHVEVAFAREIAQEAAAGEATARAVAAGEETAGEATAHEEIEVVARLWGGTGGGSLTEVKAVTYHGLSAERGPGGSWRATVLLDV